MVDLLLHLHLFLVISWSFVCHEPIVITDKPASLAETSHLVIADSVIKSPCPAPSL